MSIAKLRPLVPWTPARWSLQFASGLHLDRIGWTAALNKLQPVAPRLALLGDITSLSHPLGQKELHRFLRDASKAWDTIYWVPGVSEFCSFRSGPAPPYQLFELRDRVQAAATDRLQILDQGEVHIPEHNIVLLGTTGWCRPAATIPVPAPLEYSNMWLTDARGLRRLAPDDFRELHKLDREWLSERITWWGRHRPGTRIVLLTHHNPLGLYSAPEVKTMNDLIRVSLDTMSGAQEFSAPPVVAWLSGRAPGGSNTSGMLGDTFFASNDATATGYLSDRAANVKIVLR